MPELELYQYILIALTFVWSGFVRSGLGFGGAVLSLPFMLLIDDRPLVYLPIVSVHLLFFAGITLYKNWKKTSKESTENNQVATHVDWVYLKGALRIMIIPKLVGVLGLITLPAYIMSGIIFSIVALYALSYILNRPFTTNSKKLDIVFLIIGAYFSGTSLIGGPLIVAVFSSHVAREQLRDTIFALWMILVSIKMIAFIYAGVDLNLLYHLWLLPCAGVGHLVGLRFHRKMLEADPVIFYRVLGSVLLLVSVFGLAKIFY
jgi:uncharacterized membrane protein YfcA